MVKWLLVVLLFCTDVEVQLERVIDGDTIDVSRDGIVFRVRILGINSPERGQPGYKEAKKFLEELLPPRFTLQPEPGEKFKRGGFGRILAYILLPDGRDAGAELLRHGHAVVFLKYPCSRTESYQTIREEM